MRKSVESLPANWCIKWYFNVKEKLFHLFPPPTHRPADNYWLPKGKLPPSRDESFVACPRDKSSQLEVIYTQTINQIHRYEH